MNGDELAKLVRRGTGTLRADDLVLDTGKEKLTGRGYLHIKRRKLVIAMTLDAGSKVEDHHLPRARVATRSDFWTLTGVIDLDLRFHCHFGPGPSVHTHNETETLKATVNPLRLEPSGPSFVPVEKRKRRWEQVRRILNEPCIDADFDAAEAVRLADPSFEFEANFVSHELSFPNADSSVRRINPFLGEGVGFKTDTLMGETPTYKFAFIQNGKGSDLRLILRSKEGQPVFTEAQHWRKYDALTAALAFVHGINAWPFRLQYRRGSDKCSDQIAPASPAPRTSHAPFSGISHDKNIAEFLPRLAERLEPDTPFNDKITTLMYLVRQAGAKSVHGKIGSLALCAALESLTKILFRA